MGAFFLKKKIKAATTLVSGGKINTRVNVLFWWVQVAPPPLCFSFLFLHDLPSSSNSKVKSSACIGPIVELSEIARSLGLSRQTVTNAIKRFSMGEGSVLVMKSPGRPHKLNAWTVHRIISASRRAKTAINSVVLLLAKLTQVCLAMKSQGRSTICRTLPREGISCVE
jgi:transposase